MPNIRHSLGRTFVFPLVAVSLVFGASATFASSIIGSRNASATFSIDPNRTAYITGLTESEARSVTASNYLDIVKPYDAEKTGITDTMHCWAATAANMLAYTGWGNVNGFQTEDDIFAYFSANFTDKGGVEGFGIEWFLTGNYALTGLDGYAQPTTPSAGGFWPNANVADTSNISLLGDESFDAGILGYVSMIDNVSELNSLTSYLQKDYAVSLTVGGYDEEGNFWGHSVAAWGVTYDKAGNLLSLLISDSDNDYGGGVDAPDTLNELFLEFNEAGNYYGFSSDDDYYQYCALIGFTYLAAVPEPSTFMLFGLGIVTIALTRRKRA